MKAKEVIKLLEADGWVQKRATGGSHLHYVHPMKKGKITVPMHGNCDLKPGTVASILKQAGMVRCAATDESGYLPTISKSSNRGGTN